MAKQPSHRSYVSDFQIVIGGLLNTIGDLVGTKVTNAGREERMQLVCPVCQDAHPVKQFYKCTDDPSHTDFVSGDCMKARDEDGVLIKLTSEQITEAKKSELPEKKLEIRVHRLDDVRDSVVPESNAYLFRPRDPDDAVYQVILQYLDLHPEYVLMGLTQYRNNEKCVMLRKGLNGHLYVQELVWPEDIREFEAPKAVEHDDKFDKAIKLLQATLDASVEDFDSNEYRKESRKRIATLVSLVSAGQPEPKPSVKTSNSIDDLLAVLEQVKAAN